MLNDNALMEARTPNRLDNVFFDSYLYCIDQLLPTAVGSRLREGLKEFGKKMRGYRTNEAVVVAVESRTSSPVRIPRDPSTLEHVGIAGLYPCGEGAGYAGGIVSAAMDGQRVADHVAERYAVRR